MANVKSTIERSLRVRIKSGNNVVLTRYYGNIGDQSFSLLFYMRVGNRQNLMPLQIVFLNYFSVILLTDLN